MFSVVYITDIHCNIVISKHIQGEKNCHSETGIIPNFLLNSGFNSAIIYTYPNIEYNLI